MIMIHDSCNVLVKLADIFLRHFASMLISDIGLLFFPISLSGFAGSDNGLIE